MGLAEDEDGELFHGSQFLRLEHLVSGGLATPWQELRLLAESREAIAAVQAGVIELSAEIGVSIFEEANGAASSAEHRL